MHVKFFDERILFWEKTEAIFWINKKLRIELVWKLTKNKKHQFDMNSTEIKLHP